MLELVLIAKSTLMRTDETVKPLDPVRIELIAWPWHCDALGHVNNAEYLHMMSAGRYAWLTRLGLLKQAIRQRYAFVVAGAGITYRRQIPRMTRFAIETRIANFDERWLSFEYTMVRREADGERVAARGFSRGQIQHKRRPVNPREALERMRPGLRLRSPEPSQDFQLWLDSQSAAIDHIRRRDEPTRA
jgi:acyl-CoA thioesterase FadM